MSTKPFVWRGRVDVPQRPETTRWHQIVSPWSPQDIVQKLPLPPFVLLGFACDEGVRRNGGRQGAQDGPDALRGAMANLPVHTEKFCLKDAGDVLCERGDLESAQRELAARIHDIAKYGAVPIVLGGGHETAYGHYLGLRSFLDEASRKGKKARLGIVNIDAHFDLRPYPDGGHSGSPFLQIADQALEHGHNFSYFCLGIQRAANTQQLYATAKRLKVQHLPAETVRLERFAAIKKALTTFAHGHDALYVTVCLDAIAAAFAPGVSAPSVFGVFPDVVAAIIRHLSASGKVVGFDVAELAPSFDRDNQTAKLAAGLVFNFVDGFARKGQK